MITADQEDCTQKIDRKQGYTKSLFSLNCSGEQRSPAGGGARCPRRDPELTHARRLPLAGRCSVQPASLADDRKKAERNFSTRLTNLVQLSRARKKRRTSGGGAGTRAVSVTGRQPDRRGWRGGLDWCSDPVVRHAPPSPAATPAVTPRLPRPSAPPLSQSRPHHRKDRDLHQEEWGYQVRRFGAQTYNHIYRHCVNLICRPVGPPSFKVRREELQQLAASHLGHRVELFCPHQVRYHALLELPRLSVAPPARLSARSVDLAARRAGGEGARQGERALHRKHQEQRRPRHRGQSVECALQPGRTAVQCAGSMMTETTPACWRTSSGGSNTPFWWVRVFPLVCNNVKCRCSQCGGR